jgi:primosomal protein N'
MLGISDFRASERTFALITQAAGRAGRGETAGEVIIQAYNTDDYAILCGAAQDYERFYRQEIAFRRAMRYPPFGAIGQVLVTGVSEKAVREKILQIESLLKARLADFPPRKMAVALNCSKPAGRRFTSCAADTAGADCQGAGQCEPGPVPAVFSGPSQGCAAVFVYRH